MQIIIKQLVWDDWNQKHIKKHKVTIREIELSLKDPYLVYIIGHSSRVMSLGRSKKRLITQFYKSKKNNSIM